MFPETDSTAAATLPASTIRDTSRGLITLIAVLYKSLQILSIEILLIFLYQLFFLHLSEYKIKTPAVRTIILRPEMKNQPTTPTFSAIGLLKSKPIGIVIEEIKVSTENARPIFSGDIVSCI